MRSEQLLMLTRGLTIWDYFLDAVRAPMQIMQRGRRFSALTKHHPALDHQNAAQDAECVCVSYKPQRQAPATRPVYAHASALSSSVRSLARCAIFLPTS